MTCEHGQLARQCPICERDAEIARLAAEIDRLLRWREQTVTADAVLAESARSQRDAAIADRDRAEARASALAAENERLRQALRDVIQHQQLIGGSASLHSATVAIARAALGEGE